jgi:hypothetical protein
MLIAEFSPRSGNSELATLTALLKASNKTATKRAGRRKW